MSKTRIHAHSFWPGCWRKHPAASVHTRLDCPTRHEAVPCIRPAKHVFVFNFDEERKCHQVKKTRVSTCIHQQLICNNENLIRRAVLWQQNPRNHKHKRNAIFKHVNTSKVWNRKPQSAVENQHRPTSHGKKSRSENTDCSLQVYSLRVILVYMGKPYLVHAPKYTYRDLQYLEFSKYTWGVQKFASHVRRWWPPCRRRHLAATAHT